jgi:sugar lactone lactonase YvrE
MKKIVPFFIALFLLFSFQKSTSQCTIPPNISYSNVNGLYYTGRTITALTPINNGDAVARAANSLSTLGIGYNFPFSIILDGEGNQYVSDSANNEIKKIEPNGTSTTIGSGFNFPAGIALNSVGDLFICDFNSGELKKVTTNGTISTLLNGVSPAAIVLDSSGNIYFSNFADNSVNKLDTNGFVTTIGSGFGQVFGLALDTSGNLYVADTSNNEVKKVDTNGIITTIGTEFSTPTGITLDSNGNLYITEQGNSAVKKIEPNGTITTLMSSGFSNPSGIVVDDSSNVIVTDTGDNTIKKITIGTNYTISPALPSGLSFNTETGVISGTPTAVSSATIYTIATQNGCGNNSTNVTFATAPCPSILTQPTAPLICTTVGSTSSVSITTDVTAPNYTWQMRVVSATLPDPIWVTITSTNAGTVYSNFNSATLGITRTSTMPRAGTQFRAIINGSACGDILTSDVVTISIIGTVRSGMISSPMSVCTDGTISFTVSNFVGDSLQWQSAPNATGTFVNLPEQTGSSLTLSNATAAMDKSYRVVVTNSTCGGTTAITPIRTIRVDPFSQVGSITGGGVVCNGSSGTVRTVGNIGRIEWEYSLDDDIYLPAPTAATIAGLELPFSTTSTSRTLAMYLVTNITGTVYFRAKITSGACSSDYTSIVGYQIGETATVSTLESDTPSLCPGTGTTLRLTDATGAITWQRTTGFNNPTPVWTNITGATGITYSTPNLTVSTAYRAIVTIGSCSTVTSNTVIVNVTPKPVARNVLANTTTPSGTTEANAICTNDSSKILSITSGFSGNIQWQVSTTSSTAGFVDIPGETGVSYTVANAQVGPNYYRASFTNSCGIVVFGRAITLFYKACRTAENDAVIVETNESTSTLTSFDVISYPNPFTTGFKMNVTTSNDNVIQYIVYDMTGRMVEQREVSPSQLGEQEIGHTYPTGVYNVIVTQDEEVKTLRVIKR